MVSDMCAAHFGASHLFAKHWDKVVSWDQRFYDPIILPGRKPLVTLRDAALYITKLPKAEHDADEWQPRWWRFCWVAERDGPTMFARIGVMRALQRHQPKSRIVQAGELAAGRAGSNNSATRATFTTGGP
jgi:hypothetical protein